MERRVLPRIPSSTGVKLYFNGSGRVHGHLTNFSQGGVAVALEKTGELPAIDEIVFMLPDNMDEPYTMKALRCTETQWVLTFIEENT